MNYAMIVYIIGWILVVEAALMTPSLICSLICRESCASAFIITIALCLIIGIAMTRRRPKSSVFYIREGFVITALSWIVMSIMGCLPFVISGAIPNVINAFFETVSGFTTTGASILDDVESLPKGILFWRSFTHWIGGMGVIVFLLSLLPLAGGGYSMNLMKAESPGPSVSKFVPTVRDTAKILYTIYIIITVSEFVLLLLGGMSLFDSLCTAFGTAGTGGFGVKNDSIGGYSTYTQIVVTIFMILFGINFNFYFLIGNRKFKEAFHIEEVRWYLGIVVAAIIFITIMIRNMYGSLGEALRLAAFQVGAIITTTGFATADFNLWPEAVKMLLVTLMFVGACAGSTGGGIKISRIVLMVKSVIMELFHQIHPHSVKRVEFEGSPVSPELLRSIAVFFLVYIVVFVLSFFIISFDNYDFTTNFTAITATLNNIGPGLNLVGPTGNYLFFSPLSKIVLCFDMLAGRLELFPVLMLLYPETWKKF